ncbi:peptidoglycan recognition protein family protein [Streptomyces collinus]
MAWYPGAVKMELQPESDSQPAIRPTQFIVHSIIAPWTARRTYEYWRDSTNLESHFGIDYAGTVGQYIGTHTRADANAGANRRADGTGAVSAETASNTSGSDPWNAKQIEDLIALGAWLHKEEGIPLRICRSHSDPGYGYHSMFPQWSTSGTACPGKARIKQFREVVFPGIVARATGKTNPQEDDVSLTSAQAKQLSELHARLVPYAGWSYKGTGEKTDAYAHLRNTSAGVKALATQVAALTATVNKLAQLAGSDVDTQQVVDAVERAIADAVVKVDVDITHNQEA